MEQQTILALAGQQTDSAYNSIVPPLYQTAIFRFEDFGETRGYDYTRSGNPTRAVLEEALAKLEGGCGAVATGSGMSAISTCLALYECGAHILCSHDCYGGTERLFRYYREQGQLEFSFVDFADKEALRAAIRPNTRALWLETPSNPLLRIVDISATAGLCREHDGLHLIVDNTLLSPALQQPLALGADIVVHSTTKYINGHSDVIGGAVIAADAELNQRLQFAANALGTTAQPFDCWLILRGLKTLHLRMRQHEKNAGRIARFLREHPAVDKVYYPGLAEHPGHGLAARQQSGFGGLVSFTLHCGSDKVREVLRATRVFALAVSLGGVESLIEHPASMSHASMSPEQREAAGLGDSLIRLSLGIESAEDLINDLSNALALAEPRNSLPLEEISAWEL